MGERRLVRAAVVDPAGEALRGRHRALGLHQQPESSPASSRAVATLWRMPWMDKPPGVGRTDARRRTLPVPEGQAALFAVSFSPSVGSSCCGPGKQPRPFVSGAADDRGLCGLSGLGWVIVAG
ncbi:hypothetical protein GCM10010140_60480 [Streptosporangium pseudovulgare]|uniref:Uncharacterized protein n=1 Tax=Streptosporangium pseudovulgare TaxID=35765 RepID=A0ABQ2REN2_9ACTN|nr:hypothetical protein GCM10010140_60480 [Streptosporangium pseudovulgare]